MNSHKFTIVGGLVLRLLLLWLTAEPPLGDKNKIRPGLRAMDSDLGPSTSNNNHSDQSPIHVEEEEEDAEEEGGLTPILLILFVLSFTKLISHTCWSLRTLHS